MTAEEARAIVEREGCRNAVLAVAASAPPLNAAQVDFLRRTGFRSASSGAGRTDTREDSDGRGRGASSATPTGVTRPALVHPDAAA